MSINEYLKGDFKLVDYYYQAWEDKQRIEDLRLFNNYKYLVSALGAVISGQVEIKEPLFLFGEDKEENIVNEENKTTDLEKYMQHKYKVFMEQKNGV